jgi:DNA primase
MPALERSQALEWAQAECDAVDQAMAVFQRELLNDPRALKCLADNGISRAAIGHFGLGYAVRAASKGIPSGETYEGAKLRGRLQDVGILRMSGCVHFSGSIVAPVRNESGKIVDIYGRKISPKLKQGSAYHTSIYDPPQGVFNLPALFGKRQVVLCGDLFDALSFWSGGVQNVTTMVGPRGFTELHLEVFEAIGIKEVVIALPPGREDAKTARTIAQALASVDIHCTKTVLPREVDNAVLLADIVRNGPLIWQDAGEMQRDVRQ